MVVSNQVKNQHLLWRAGFGPSLADVAGVHALPVASRFAAMADASKSKPRPFTLANNMAEGIFMGLKELKRQADTEKEKKAFQKQSREMLRNLNLEWLDVMVSSPAQMREKLSLFWHGHFACRNLNVFFQQGLINTIREHALGNFGDLLRAVSKTPAMLAFLNNQQNRKSHPNENFAREVMELFTIGRGHYTETDVKEAARAFTGWGFNLQGEFVFRRAVHDDGKKTVLGKTGNFTGDEVIDILLENETTARFITRKMYRFFVNAQVNENHVAGLSKRFYQSGYSIPALLKDMFTSEWFYNQQNIGTHIKSPVELLVGLRRMLPVNLPSPEAQLLLQRALGQVLFYPPNVAGWPGGNNWIDSSSLMLRMRLPQLIAGNDVLNVSAKADDDQQMGRGETMNMDLGGRPTRQRNVVQATIDWAAFARAFGEVPRTQLYSTLESSLLQTPQGSIQQQVVQKVIDSSSRDQYIKTAAIAFMSTPQYQLS